LPLEYASIFIARLRGFLVTGSLKLADLAKLNRTKSSKIHDIFADLVLLYDIDI